MMMNMLAIVISLACAGFVLLRELLFKHSGQRCRKNHKQAPPVARLPLGASPKPEILVPKSYRCGLERTGADMRSTSAVGEAIFAPASKPAMQGWGTLVGKPSPPPALPARAELRDAEVHALLGELDAGERLQTGDATAEELQALANFDIRAFA